MDSLFSVALAHPDSAKVQGQNCSSLSQLTLAEILLGPDGSQDGNTCEILWAAAKIRGRGLGGKKEREREREVLIT